MAPDVKNLRYIVFLLNPEIVPRFSDGTKVETHEGAIFRTPEEAREYAESAVKDNMCTRFAIGVFVWDELDPMMYISHIETFGFKHDKKRIEQLELF